MKLARGIGVSLSALWSNRPRALLVVATIALGVCAVITTGALGAGAEREVARSLATLGTNLLIVRPAEVPRSVVRREVSGRFTTLALADVAPLSQLPDVAGVAPGADGSLLVKSGRVATGASVMGTTPAYLHVRGYRLTAGRFIEEDDDRRSARVVVLGARVAEALFPNGGAIGSSIAIRRVPFEVIGTLAAKGVTADGGDEDNQVVMPVRTALRRVFNRTWINTLFVSVRDRRMMDEARVAVVGTMRGRHRPTRLGGDDFAVQNTLSVVARQERTLALLGRATTVLALVTFLAGGAGVLMLMWLSVNERTTEIGLRAAVGATPGLILWQFMMEAMVLTLTGWMAGLTSGALVIGALATATAWPVALPRETAGFSLALMALTALLPGLLPAVRAARVTPISALQGA